MRIDAYQRLETDRAERSLRGNDGPGAPACSVMSYDDLFRAREIPAGASIFCDHERLSDIELQAAEPDLAAAA